jgi:hypothetical protein
MPGTDGQTDYFEGGKSMWNGTFTFTRTFSDQGKQKYTHNDSANSLTQYNIHLSRVLSPKNKRSMGSHKCTVFYNQIIPFYEL